MFGCAEKYTLRTAHSALEYKHIVIIHRLPCIPCSKVMNKRHICLERQKSVKHLPPSLTRAPLANCTLRGLSHFSDAPSFSRNCTLCLFSSVELHRRQFASSFASIYNTNNVTCEPLSLWAPLLSENSGAKCHNYRK